MTEATVSTPRTSPDKSSVHRLKVIVVEDFKKIRETIVKTLSGLDMDVFEADNGLDALKVLDGRSVDLVMTDLVMPELDGFELCEEIRRRANTRNLPIVVISTHRDAKYVIRALRCGADDYLTKPFTAAAAERIVERVMNNVQ